MSDSASVPSNDDPNSAPPPNAPTPPPGDPGVIPKVRFDEVNDRMKAAERELEKVKAAQAKADEERLAGEKKFEDLAARRATERDDWKAKAESALERATAMEARLHAIVDERVKALPEKLRARIPSAETADVEARFEKIEDVEAVLAELPTAAPPPLPPLPGNARPPRPAAASDPASAVDVAREMLLRRGGYTL